MGFGLVKTGVVERMVDNYLAKQAEEEKQQKKMGDPNQEVRHITAVTPSVEQMSKTSDDAVDSERVEAENGVNGQEMAIEMESMDKTSGDSKKNDRLARAKERALRGVNEDIHDDMGALETAIQENAEDFDPKTERAFSWLQVCTATLDIFAHGSNDVANAVAPFAAMVALYEVGEAQEEVPVYEWILVIGAAGMVLGLATYGYKIMKCLGVRMAPMTCTRGYCIELSSALVVILASHYGFPTSTTHAQVGATVGIGLVELNRPDTKLSISQVVNWKLLAQVLFGWVLTLFVAGMTSALIFAVLAYSPYAGEPIVRS